MKTALRKTLEIAAWSIASILLLALAAIVALTLYLTPQRLTDIINREASERLNADIKASNVRYTIWSTFPRLAIETDSIRVISRALQGAPKSVMAALPQNADFLASLRSLSGEINLVDFISGRYVIHDIKVKGLNINLVAYNDSLNNYNIIPDDTDGFKSVPYMTANDIDITDSGKITFFSAATGTSAAMKIGDLHLLRTHEAPLISRRHRDDYRLTIGGKITAVAAGLPVLTNFPFYLNGKMQLRFNPFGVSLSDYAINLGDVKGKLSMSLGVGDDPAVEQFDYHITTLNLMKLLGYLPAKYLPDLEGIRADLPVSASARLTAPWHLSSQSLPSIEVDFAIPSGEVFYTLASPAGSSSTSTTSPRSKTFRLLHSPLKGSLMFDGDNPAMSVFNIDRFSLSADGVTCQAEGRVSDLTTDPLVDIDLDCNADIRKAARSLAAISAVKGAKASGNLDANTRISFRLSDFSGKSIADGLYAVRLAGDVKLRDFALAIPAEKIDARASKAVLHFGARAASLTESRLSNSLLDLSADIDRASATIDGHRIAANGVHIATKAADKNAITRANISQGLPVALRASIRKASYKDPAGDYNVDAGNIATTLSVARRKKPYTPASPRMTADRDAALPHTPEYVAVNLPANIRDALSAYDFNVTLKCRELTSPSPAWLRHDRVTDLDLTLSPDSVRINNLATEIESTGLRLSATVSRLRDFLLDTVGPRPVDIDMNLALDTVNINSLAHTWFMAHGGVPAQKTTLAPQAADSVAMMIPRNINARIMASARETVYTNLRLYDLYTTLSLRNGVAAVNGLNISSDFGHGALDLVYDTSDIDDMGFKANVALTHINIVNFFKNFHTLLLMEPQMKNLTGEISVSGSAAGELFPDMVINTPSLHADFNLHGRKLKVHQSDFIRHVTRMMLISNDNDLHIKDMNVFAHVHGNLLQLDPFDFQFDDYKLRMLGINNFDGNLYYHVAVLENPFHLPFSINIEGLFRNPELHFGGTRYDTRHAMRISENIMEQNDVNIVCMAKNFIREFLRKAAQAAEDPSMSL